jgi:hypothetical protein
MSTNILINPLDGLGGRNGWVSRSGARLAMTPENPLGFRGGGIERGQTARSGAIFPYRADQFFR